jgi:hypothetical protein
LDTDPLTVNNILGAQQGKKSVGYYRDRKEKKHSCNKIKNEEPAFLLHACLKYEKPHNGQIKQQSPKMQDETALAKGFKGLCHRLSS